MIPDVVGDAAEDDSGGGMIVVKDVDFCSLCRSHLLPFFGKVHIGYLPEGGKMLQSSKIAQVVDVLSHRLQGKRGKTCSLSGVLI